MNFPLFFFCICLHFVVYSATPDLYFLTGLPYVTDEKGFVNCFVETINKKTFTLNFSF